MGDNYGRNTKHPLHRKPGICRLLNWPKQDVCSSALYKIQQITNFQEAFRLSGGFRTFGRAPESVLIRSKWASDKWLIHRQDSHLTLGNKLGWLPEWLLLIWAMGRCLKLFECQITQGFHQEKILVWYFSYQNIYYQSSHPKKIEKTISTIKISKRWRLSGIIIAPKSYTYDKQEFFRALNIKIGGRK